MGKQMTTISVENQPSETALFAALRRTLAYMEYQNDKFGPDSLAQIFLPSHYRFFLQFKKIRDKTKNKLATFFPGLNEYMIARTAYFDKLFMDALKNETPQIVLMGAGYDSRAYRFVELNRGSQIYELDIAPTQIRKVKCLKAAHVEIPPQVKFIPINFNLESMSDVLEKAGYKSDIKTLFIWEGVSYYLDRKSVDESLAFVSHSAKGSMIGFDYTISITAENQDKYYGAKEFAQSMRQHHAAEELLFTLGEGKISSFLEHKGLKVVEHLNTEEIEKTVLTNENGSMLGQITGNFRFIIASPLEN